jgi:hypothetical protein
MISVLQMKIKKMLPKTGVQQAVLCRWGGTLYLNYVQLSSDVPGEENVRKKQIMDLYF